MLWFDRAPAGVRGASEALSQVLAAYSGTVMYVFGTYNQCVCTSMSTLLLPEELPALI